MLRRSNRRTIGLLIDRHGLRASAPRRAALRDVEALILKHADWVMKKLGEWEKRPPPEMRSIVDGLTLPLLGQTLTLRLASGNNRAFWNEFAAPTLTLCLRSPAEAGKQLEKALRHRALQDFGVRIAHFSGQMGVPVPSLALSSARTRWGSCSAKTGVRLNWRLIHFPPHLVDYVVIHELAHLREMNHSRRFWTIVETFCPEWRECRSELKQRARECLVWEG